MSKNDDIRESLLSIGELLKQLTEEVNELANCFYEDDEDDEDDEANMDDNEEEDVFMDAENLARTISFEDKMNICACCDCNKKYNMCTRLYDSNCTILIKKIWDMLREERAKEGK